MQTPFDNIAAAVKSLSAKDRRDARDRVRQAMAGLGRALTGCDRAVVEALLTRVNWDTGYCYPGAGRLAADTGFSRRQVIRSRQKLDTLGITVSPAFQSGQHRNQARRVTFPGLVTPVSPAGDRDVTRPGDGDVTTLVTPVSPEPSEENQVKTTSARKRVPVGEHEPDRTDDVVPLRPREGVALQSSRSRLKADEGFASFWADYPRKDAKAEALKAWRKLTANQQAQATAALPAFMAKLKRERTETQFIPHAATWINGERWTDVEAAATGQSKANSGLVELWKEPQAEQAERDRARMNGGADGLH